MGNNQYYLPSLEVVLIKSASEEITKAVDSRQSMVQWISRQYLSHSSTSKHYIITIIAPLKFINTV